jgi:HNH endonuclease
VIHLQKENLITKLCEIIESKEITTGSDMIRLHYPLKKREYTKRSYTKAQMLNIFMRDGFVDRYSGKKLVFPPVLRVLSLFYPKEFPYHPNWKTNECHQAYWDLLPTIDHIVPIAKGGNNTKENLVSTCMMRNSIKANFTLEELGWELHPPGNLEVWNGQLTWFMDVIIIHPEFLEVPYIKEWFAAASKVLK